MRWKTVLLVALLASLAFGGSFTCSTHDHDHDHHDTHTATTK